MKRTNFGYFVKESFRDLFLHGFMTFASICVIVACLIIMGSFVMVILNIESAISDLEQENEILVYVDENLSDSEARSVGSQINMIENVLTASFISRSEALDNFVETQDNPEIFSGLDDTFFRNRYSVHLVDISQMKDTIAQLKSISGVSDVNAHLELAEGFSTVRNIVNVVSAAIILVLFVVSVFIISNTVKLALFGRREEIAIMKMVGATNWFIRWPFLIEGMIMGLVGALIAFFAEWGLYELVVTRVALADTLSLLELIPFQDVILPMALIFGGVGFLVGVGGSLLSIRKFLKV